MSKKKAIALSYPSDADAPFVVASSKGLLAEKLIEIAKQNKVPIYEDKLLANTLSVLDIGTCIPEETYEVLAKIFAFIKKTENI